MRNLHEYEIAVVSGAEGIFSISVIGGGEILYTPVMPIPVKPPFHGQPIIVPPNPI